MRVSKDFVTWNLCSRVSEGFKSALNLALLEKDWMRVFLSRALEALWGDCWCDTMPFVFTGWLCSAVRLMHFTFLWHNIFVVYCKQQIATTNSTLPASQCKSLARHEMSTAAYTVYTAFNTNVDTLTLYDRVVCLWHRILAIVQERHKTNKHSIC